MVYGMVQRHSADLEIESAPGRALRCAHVCKSHSEELTPPQRTGHVPQQFPMQRLRILLVDDDPLLIKSMRTSWKQTGTRHGGSRRSGGHRHLHGGVSGRSCLRLVITDLGMPHVDGRKVAAAVKAAPPRTPVIMLTGWGKRLLAENDIPAHVDRVLSKPPRLVEVRAALVELVPAGPAAASAGQTTLISTG